MSCDHVHFSTAETFSTPVPSRYCNVDILLMLIQYTLTTLQLPQHCLAVYLMRHINPAGSYDFINDPTITDRIITQFIRQCPCCKVMSRLKILIKTHPFSCASYNPFESLHIDCDTTVRTKYVLPVTSPVSLLTQTSFHHTFCTVHTVHTVCSPSLL